MCVCVCVCVCAGVCVCVCDTCPEYGRTVDRRLTTRGQPKGTLGIPRQGNGMLFEKGMQTMWRTRGFARAQLKKGTDLCKAYE